MYRSRWPWTTLNGKKHIQSPVTKKWFATAGLILVLLTCLLCKFLVTETGQFLPKVSEPPSAKNGLIPKSLRVEYNTGILRVHVKLANSVDARMWKRKSLLVTCKNAIKEENDNNRFKPRYPENASAKIIQCRKWWTKLQTAALLVVF